MVILLVFFSTLLVVHLVSLFFSIPVSTLILHLLLLVVVADLVGQYYAFQNYKRILANHKKSGQTNV
jgi:hypothetical protein